MMMHLVRLIRWMTWHRRRRVEPLYWSHIGEIPVRSEDLNPNDLGLYLFTTENLND